MAHRDYSKKEDQAPEGVFSPPIFNPEKHLGRDLERLGFPASSAALPPFIFIEGQTGQGKTTLAAQLISRRSEAVCWYRMEAADRSAPYLLANLLLGLKRLAPEFSPPSDASILCGEVPRTQTAPLLASVLSAFSQCCKDVGCLILDDVHLCLSASETTPLLATLIQDAPANLHLIVIGRRNLASLAAIAKAKGPTLLFGTRQLAFTAAEIAALFNSNFQVPMTRRAVRAAHKLTDGWVMGLQLMARSLKNDDPELVEQELDQLSQKTTGVFDRLFEQLLAELPREQLEALFVLSILDDIPVELAQQLTGRKAIGKELAELAADNFFVYPLGEQKDTFVLHHLFRSGLRHRLRHYQTEAEVRRLHALAAAWFQELGKLDQAIRYYLAACDYPRAEAVCRAGLQSKDQHKLTALWPVFGKLPDETLACHPWFAYYHGFGLMGEDLAKAYPFMQLAYRQFVQQSDPLGELISSAQMMFFSVASDGHYARGYPLLDRSMELLDQLVDSLPPLVLGHIANIAVTANTFLRYNPRQAERYFHVGLDVARREGLPGLEAEARVARLYCLIFSGDWQSCRNELEAALPLLQDPLISQLHRGAIFLAFMGYLKGSGDFDAYERYKAQLLQQADAALFRSSVSEAYILLWDLQLHLARGERAQAEEILKRAELAPAVKTNPHQKNLFLQYAALLAAESGRREEAVAAIESARQMRQEAGGHYYNALNDAFFGATYDFLGEDAAALNSFERALHNPSSLLRETTLAFRACYYQRRRDPRMLDDLKQLLTSLRNAQHSHFYGWMQEDMAGLLSVAVRENIDAPYARQIAEERLSSAILNDGTHIPLLEILSLGAMQFRVANQMVLSDADLGEAARQVLAVLISQPACSCPQKKLQLLLWPESDESKARNNFDKLLSRLRKTFERALGPQARHYLQLKNGILSLCHCRIDANQFMAWAKDGHRHYRQGQLWQAENLLHKATSVYQGEFLPSAPDDDLVESRRLALLQMFQTIVLIYSEVLLAFKRPQQARSLLEKSLSYDPIHEESVKKLYSLLIAQEMPSRAQQVINRYGDTLRGAGFEPAEIRDTLEAFWNS